MIDMQDAGGSGVLIDMEYEIIDGVEKIIDVSIRNIINNIVGEIVEPSNPLYKLAFATNFLTMLEQERNKK